MAELEDLRAVRARQQDNSAEPAAQRLRAKAANQAGKDQSLAYVSLPRLMAQVQAATREGKELSEDLRYLSGMTQVRYVFVFADEKDLVIAGSAEPIDASLPGFQLEGEIQSVPWTNSDHQPFLVAGIPSISPYGSLEGSKARYYHDFADSFDKANGKGLCEAAAVVAVLVRELAGSGLAFRRATKEEIIQLLRKHGVEERLKRQKEWPY